jgi:transcriptional regulator with PAS, ATPase and Fis domain
MNLVDQVPTDVLDGMTPELLNEIEKTMPELAEQYRAAINKHKPQLIYWLDRFITKHPDMIEMKRRIRIVAGETDPVLLLGETGTGKELLANALHASRKGRFIPVNCAGIPEHLMESELFGHIKGAFTGAACNKRGILEEAQDGSVFLDEIGELPMTLQAKLLRALQENKIRPVGANDETIINCRIISATNKNLEHLIETKKFREDLYWRISTITMKTLPLAVRRGDLPLLIEYYDTEKVIPNVEQFVQCIDNIKHLRGNVRSLQQLIRRYQLFNEFPA